MVPAVFFQIAVLCPQGNPLVPGSYLKTQPSKPLIAQQEALLLILIVLPHNGGQVLVSGSRTIGIIPIKGSGSDPDTDAEGFSLYQNRFRGECREVGAAIKEQTPTLYALFPPLGGSWGVL